MEIRSSEDAMENIIRYARAINDLQIAKKAIDDDIKQIKQDYKEEGVAVGKVTKVLNQIKARAKMNESDKLEEDILYEKLEADEGVQNDIAILNN